MGMAPFMGPEDKTGHRGLNMTRIVEALIIAAVIGTINVIGTNQVFEERFKYIKEQISEIKQSLIHMQKDIYRPYYHNGP